MKKLVAAVAVGALVLSGCSINDDEDAQRICVDRDRQRVSDDRCDAGGSNDYLWWYMAYNATVPRTGGYVKSGTRVKPPSFSTRSLPKSGYKPPSSSSRSGGSSFGKSSTGGSKSFGGSSGGSRSFGGSTGGFRGGVR